MHANLINLNGKVRSNKNDIEDESSGEKTKWYILNTLNQKSYQIN